MTELNAGAVTVADLYREIVGMRADVAQALTRIEVINVQNADADKLHADHEARIRQLEAFRWKLAGIAVVLAIIAGFLSAWFSSVHH